MKVESELGVGDEGVRHDDAIDELHGWLLKREALAQQGRPRLVQKGF